MARLRALAARPLARPDASALFLVLGVAAALRLAFLFRAPPLYVGGDSQTYLQPAVELLQGLGFAPLAKRPPLYPLFIASSLSTLGFDLQGLNFAQHLLGTVTAGATYGLGRLIFGRLAGLLAGLAVAANGSLLIYEHYVMAETLFTCLLTLALFGLVAAARRPSAGRLLAAGLLLGLASATRQSAQALIVLAPLALLLSGQGWRAAARGSGLVLAGFLVVVAPWLAFDYARNRTVSSGTLGETLIWRLTRSGQDNEFFKWRLAPVADARQQEARRFAFSQAADRVLPSDIKIALQQRFGLDEAEADRLLRTLGFEAIAQRPDRYLAGSFGLLLEHLLGTEQWLGGQGKEGGRVRYADVQAKYQDWWSDRTRPLIQNASPAQEQEFRRAQWLANLYQPYRFGPLLLGLLLLGILAGLLRPAWRLALVPALAATILLVLVAFLAGALPRYRYPADPLLAVLQAGGLVGLLAAVRQLGLPLLGRRGTGRVRTAAAEAGR